MNGKTIFQILIIIILSAIFMPGQGQTDQSTTTTTTTNDAEIHDYDITINSLENSHYKIGLKNNLLLSELDVFFDGKFVGSIPKGPAWKEFEVDKLPINVMVSGEGGYFTKNLRDYVPWAYQDINYSVYDYIITDDGGREVGLKIKIEYPKNLKAHEKGILDIKEITKDFGYATSPDTQNSIQTFSIINVASDESLREETSYIDTDKTTLVDPIVLAIKPTGNEPTPVLLLKPYNGWLVFDDTLRDTIKQNYPSVVVDKDVIEGIEMLFEELTLPIIQKALIIAVEQWHQENGCDWDQVCLGFAEWQEEYTLGESPSSPFSNENDYDCWTYIFGFNGFENFCTGANGVWLKLPFSFDTDGDHEIRLHLDTMFEGDIPSLGLKGGRIGEEIPFNIKINSNHDNTEETSILFPDPNLEAAIREAINKPEGAIYAEDLEGLNIFDASDKDIKDITGLEYCINLRTLDLRENQISDVSPLSRLTNLEWLFIDSGKITDVSPLSGLINLKDLVLSGNSDISGKILDISPLSHLTNLVSLELICNQITDVSPLSGLTNLTILRLGNNQIIDVSLLSGLTNLEWLDLSENKIADVSPLSRLTNLTTLELRYNQIADVSPLSGLINLRTLDLRGNLIAYVSTLSGLTNLEWLDLSENKIADISPLSRLTNLDLDLFDNEIS
jgi:Leucine-rich repeat (LRR) protein